MVPSARRCLARRRLNTRGRFHRRMDVCAERGVRELGPGAPLQALATISRRVTEMPLRVHAGAIGCARVRGWLLRLPAGGRDRLLLRIQR
eukprot:4053144-Prymnesium_polylepis.1